MADVDLAASRFRDDSELAAARPAAGGAWTPISPLLTELLAVGPARSPAHRRGRRPDRRRLAVAASATTGTSPRSRPTATVVVRPAPGWRAHRARRGAPPAFACRAGVRLDLGATAKALDRRPRRRRASPRRPAAAAWSPSAATSPSPARAPAGGWRIRVEDVTGDPDAAPAGPAAVVTIRDGGLATSSVTARRWQRDGLLAAPPGRPAHRAAARPGVADGLRGRRHLRRRERAQHRRRRPGRPGLAAAPPGPAARPAGAARRSGARPPAGWPRGACGMTGRGALVPEPGHRHHVAGAHDADRRARARSSAGTAGSRACRGSPSQGLHRNVGLLSALLLVTHVGTAVVDSYVDIGGLRRVRAVRVGLPAVRHRARHARGRPAPARRRHQPAAQPAAPVALEGGAPDLLPAVAARLRPRHHRGHRPRRRLAARPRRSAAPSPRPGPPSPPSPPAGTPRRPRSARPPPSPPPPTPCRPAPRSASSGTDDRR